MPSTFTLRLAVRQCEVDQHGFVHDHVYQHYLEEAAIQASTAVGFGPAWYQAHGTVWVVREMTIEYLRPATVHDNLEIVTWVADFRRVRSHREYEIYRLPRRELLVRASADWVYIDRRTQWPVRVPQELVTALPPEGRFALPPSRPIPGLPSGADQRVFTHRRKVQRHEIDGMHHVNNAMYVTWFEHALMETLNAWLPPDQAAVAWPCYRRHHIEYLSALRPGEEVEISTRLVGMGRAQAAWQQEVRRVGSPDVAVWDQSIVLWLDERGRPQRWPPALILTTEVDK